MFDKFTNGKGKCVAYNKCRDGRHLYILSLVFVDGSFDSNPPIEEPANGSTFGESGASLKNFKSEKVLFVDYIYYKNVYDY